MSVESIIKIEHQPKEQEQTLDQATSRIGKRSHKGLRFTLRIAVTAAMFFFLLHSVSWSRLFTTLMKVQHTALLIGLTIGGISIIFSAYSWRSLVLAERIQTDLARLIHLYLVGIAFSHFLPTSMGGDVAKAYYVGKESGNMAGAASAVLLSRVTGFLGMLLISLPALFIWHSLFKQTIVIGFLLLSLLLITMVSGTLIASTLLPRLSDRFFNTKWFANRLVITAIEVGNALGYALKRPRALCAAIGFSLLFWIASFLNYYGFAMALHMQVPFPFYIVAIAFASIVAFFP